MNPYTRLRYTLLGALLVWAPGALLTINGKMELTTSGLYFVGSILLAYIGTGVVGRINENYRQTAHRVFVAKQQIEQLERRRAAQEQNRRAEDPEN